MWSLQILLMKLMGCTNRPILNSKIIGLVVTWLLTRLWVLLAGFQVIKYPNGPSLFADVRLYDWWAANIQDGHFPINDPMWQYPPLAALIFLLGYLIAPSTIGFVFLALAADALIFYYLIESSNTRAHQRQYLAPAIWVSAAIFMGPIILGRFDVFPTFFAVSALLFANNPKIFGINLAIGAILKVWPVLLLVGQPNAVVRKSLTWFTSIFVGLSLALTFWWPNSFTFLDGQRSRGIQIESVAALPYMFWHSLISPLQIEFRFGAVEVLASGINFVSFLITAIGLILMAQVFRWRIRGQLENIPIAQTALYLVAVAIVTSRVFSPQYMVWLFGLLAVCALNPPKEFLKIFGLIATSTLFGQFLYPALYNSYMNGEVFTLLIQLVRISALLAATFYLWRNIKNQLLEIN